MTIDEAFDILHSLPPEWGASEQEVCEVEAKLGVRLPATLRELMLCTGHWDHIDWLFPRGDIGSLAALPGLQESAAEILADDSPDLHPKFPFVTLSQHDGYYFTFVRADLDTDPPIQGYMEVDGISPCEGIPLRQSIALSVMRAVSKT